MTSRTPPVPPNKDTPTEHKRVSKIDKIEKISEVDADQARARKFREMVEEPPEESTSEYPTPFELFNASPSTVSAVQPIEGSVGVSSPTAPPVEKSSSPLPEAPDVWMQVDQPPDTPTPGPDFQETSTSSSRSFDVPTQESETQTTEEPSEETAPEPQVSSRWFEKKQIRQATVSTKTGPEPSPFGVPGKPIAAQPTISSKKGEKKPLPAVSSESTMEKPAPSKIKKGEEITGAPLAPQKEEEPLPSRFEENKEESQAVLSGNAAAPATSNNLADQENPSDEEEASPFVRSTAKGDASYQKEEREERNRSSQDKRSPLQIASASLTPFPPGGLPIAQTALAIATAAVPTMSPEARAMFFHMVGTIVAMISPSGDSHTEFILNSPAFAGSKFYGATIAIEKFSTAPDALNIRLTGSTEAVTAFSQQIPSLLSAFQKGNFSFVVNRIETAYEKPLFHRKGKVKE